MPLAYATPVREYMSKGLVSVAPSADLDHVLRQLEERDVSCVVVVGSAGDLQGILSVTDLWRVARLEHVAVGLPLRVLPPERRAADVMRREVYCVGEEEPIGDAARRIVEHEVHRLVVTRDGKPQGVISTRDLMRAVAFHHVETPLGRIMTAPAATVDLGSPIEEALQRLDERNVHGLVVTDGERPVGVFTRAEAIKAAALPARVREAPVEEVTSWEVVSLDAATPLYRAAAQAIATRVRRILVLDRGKLVGLVSGLDMARVVARGE